MKKCVKKSIGLMLVASMTVSSLTGCGSTAEESKDTTSKNNVEKTDNSKTSNVEEILTNKMDTSKDSEKKESVYVEMDAEGNVTKTTVSDELKVSGSENITDYSNLSDIKNLSGDEKFTKSDDGKIVWENKGENISYQGTTTEATPINVKVTYYLDGKKISPSDLAGKSGEVKIVYNYSNTAKTEDGQFVPFLALTGMVLDDNFSNVKVDNGKVVSYNDSNIVIGYAAPGLKDHLLNTINNAEDYIKDADIPEEAYQNYSDLLAAHQVSTKISQIGVVTKESGSLLEQIRNAYNSLSDRQKSLVENYSDLEKAESAYQGLNKSDETSQIKNTAAAGETANSHSGAHESGYAKQNRNSNATGSGNAAEKSGDSKNTEQAQEKKTEETAKENQEAKAEEAENADGEETSAENETALLSGEEGDAGVSMQNGEENTAKGSAPVAQNYRVVKILCAVLGVLVILVLVGIGFMVIGSKKRKKILLKY